MNFDQLIRFAVEQGASDVHLQTDASPLLRINGPDPDGRVAAGRRPRPAAVHSFDQEGTDRRPTRPNAVRGTRLLLCHSGRVPVSLQHLQPPGHAGLGAARHQAQDPHTRRAAASAGLARYHAVTTRNDTADRDDRQRQEHDLGRDGRPDQQLLPLQDHHDRRPRRIHAHESEGHDLAARAGPGYAVIRARAATSACGRIRT